ncbi:unnamed protein product [Penicillium camemberti]|uniref:Str. FM013 n=1 Tax=Penicillium camemberti (strain FM 013) TaxID=1429867 RepID=A0A0G4PJY2_PENC3|nr:unnamed protein product [Penicillium camemberti]
METESLAGHYWTGKALLCTQFGDGSQLGRAAIPKFSPKNLVNGTLCQNYPSVLEDLTLTEHHAIAR